MALLVKYSGNDLTAGLVIAALTGRAEMIYFYRRSRWGWMDPEKQKGIYMKHLKFMESMALQKRHNIAAGKALPWKHIFERVRYIWILLFYILVISTSLVMISKDYNDAVNQRIFLDASDFSEITVYGNRTEALNEFQWIESIDIVTKRATSDGSVWVPSIYPCQVYNILDNSGYSLDQTYFSRKNLNGMSVDSLGEGEIILPYNAAAALEVSEGDTVWLKYDDSEDASQFIEYTVAGIMKSAYPCVTSSYCGGIVLMHSNLEQLEDSVDLRYCRFEDSETGDGTIIKKEQLQECSMSGILSRERIYFSLTPALVFGILLIMYCILNEKKIFQYMLNDSMVVMESMEEEQRRKRWHTRIRVFLALTAANILSVLLYRYWIMRCIYGRYVSLRVAIMCMLLLQCMDILVPVIHRRER